MADTPNASEKTDSAAHSANALVKKLAGYIL